MSLFRMQQEGELSGSKFSACLPAADLSSSSECWRKDWAGLNIGVLPPPNTFFRLENLKL